MVKNLHSDSKNWRNNSVEKSTIINKKCRYCKKEGHDIKNCFKLLNKTTLDNPPKIEIKEYATFELEWPELTTNTNTTQLKGDWTEKLNQ